MGRFDDLSDYDFELLIADLLGSELGRRFETFPRGRDDKLDLRARIGNTGFHYVQCKHFMHGTVAQLKRDAQGEAEALKAAGLKPRRYTFVTSRRLTAANKRTLLDVLAPFARDERDVLGDDDVRALLRSHPSVERAHVKLWIRGNAQLERTLHADVYARSEALVEDILGDLPRYVQTDSFSRARAILAQHKVVIVVGPPGVGKTTLARLLLLDAVRDGHTAYRVQADVAEAWPLIKEDEQQAFFFDDFLGRTELFELVGGDTRDLTDFIRRIRRSGRARLILTTREHVLRQAKLRVEELQWRTLEAEQYALTLGSYSRLERAHIFYNHVYFSDAIDRSAKADLLKWRNYLQVIDHPAYTPRLIEWMTGLSGHTLSAAERHDFSRFCISVLDNPRRLWSHVYHHGVGPTERCLLQQFAGLSETVLLSDLEAAYRSAARANGLPAGRSAFDAALKVIQDTFVRITSLGLGAGPDYVSALNPSLIDFLKDQLLDDPGEIAKALAGAWFYEQVTVLAALACRQQPVAGESVQALGGAIERTIRREGPDPTGLLGRMHWVSEEALSERLGRAAEWCKAAPALQSRIAHVVADVLDTLAHDLSVDGTKQSKTWRWWFLIDALSQAGFELTGTAHAVKRRAVAHRSLDSYELLCKLHDGYPSLFDGGEWKRLRSEFAEWARECLEQPSVWFDEVDELVRLSAVARAMAVELDGAAWSVAREEVLQSPWEQQIREMDLAVERRDLEWAEEPRPSRPMRASSDEEQIDTLFGRFQE
jgi:hypothetical protein